MTIQRAFALCFLCFTMLGVGATAWAEPVHPLIIVFPDYGVSSGKAIEVTQKDGLSPLERTRLALRAVRSQLSDSGVVDALIYLPEASIFLRAVKESNLKIAKPDAPTAEERALLGKAVGAVYVLSVEVSVPSDGASGVELVFHGEDTQTRKIWTDKTNASNNGIAPGNGGNPNVAPPTAGEFAGNVLQSAVNTLVTRLLGGPLGDYTRSTAPPSALPPRQIFAPPTAPVVPIPPPITAPTPAPPPSAEPVVVPAANALSANDKESALAAQQQAEASLASGDVGAAIVLLRRAINQSPLSLPLRLALTRAYLVAKRGDEAVSEARRALRLIPTGDRAALSELSRLLAQSLSQAGDSATARATYEEIIASQPDAHWARVALADMLAAQGEAEAAEAQYRAVLKALPGDTGAILGIARLRAAKNDYASVMVELGGLTDRSAHARAAAVLFDEGAAKLGSLLSQNRAAWEAKTLSRESLYKATAAQSSRVNNLTVMLTSVVPPEESRQIAVKAYRRRVYAASLLAQSVTALLNYLETSDADAGAQAALQLSEFQKELNQAQSDDPVSAGKI